jgi:phospholipase D-like protein/putative oligomerization/nucleic acid binding protein
MSYPLLNIFWTMFEFFVWVAWLWVLIYVIMDIFRSPDLSGGAKAGWFAFVFFIPLIGLLVYLIARGGKMHDRAEERAVRDEYRRTYMPTHSGPPAGAASNSPATTAEQLRSLADARDRGTISDQEFEVEKAKILA